LSKQKIQATEAAVHKGDCKLNTLKTKEVARLTLKKSCINLSRKFVYRNQIGL